MVANRAELAPSDRAAVEVDDVGRNCAVRRFAAIWARIVAHGVPAQVLDQLEEERVLEFRSVRDAGEIVVRIVTAFGNRLRLFSKILCI